MKIYIAGKITGLPKQQYTDKFKSAEILLRASGHSAVNPCTFGIKSTDSHEHAMLVCLPKLLECDAIYMLSNWQDSPGAVIEHQFARDNGIMVLYADFSTALIHEAV